MELEKQNLRQILDDYVQLKGLAERVSDVAINVVTNLAEEHIWPRLTDREKEAVNAWIIKNSSDGDEPIALASNDDPGQGPTDPDPDE